jgi:glyoxylase-like metal-dependent hydrolase (beta-lactamase superfamily II)
VLTPVADGVAVHRSELLQNQTVVVQGRSGVLVVDPGITTAELACLAGDLRAAGRTDSAPHSGGLEARHDEPALRTPTVDELLGSEA